MKTPVQVSIRSEHFPPEVIGINHPEAASEVSTSQADGFIQKTRQGVKLEFTQTDADGTEIGTVINALNGGAVSIHRAGAPNTSMMFQEGKVIGSFYYVEGGGMQINVSTSKLVSTLSPDGGELDIRYSLAIVGNVVEKTRVTFSVTPKKRMLS